MDFAPLTPLQKTLPYHAALLARNPQRTAPLIPLNSKNHTYKDINYNPTNLYVGKIGWGMDRSELAQSPPRVVIGASGGAGISPSMPHKTWFDKARNHEMFLDRGASAEPVNSRINQMVQSMSISNEEQKDFFSMASKTMHLMD
jgi:hypothetical protein